MIEALLQLLLNGAASGGVYALVALGYTLVFSVLGVINFAQGALFSVGGYLTYLLMGGKIGVNGALPGWGLPAGLPFPLALLLAAAGSGLIGLLVERLAFAPLRRRNAEPLLALITSLGAGVVLVNLLQLLMGAEGYAFPPSAAALAGLPAVLMIGGASANWLTVSTSRRTRPLSSSARSIRRWYTWATARSYCIGGLGGDRYFCGDISE